MHTHASFTYANAYQQSGNPPGDILLFLLLWSASRSKRGFKAADRSGFCLPVSLTEWSAASKAVSQGLEFGFCFHSVDMASPLSGLQDRAVPKKSIRPTSSCRLQARPLPVLTPLDFVLWTVFARSGFRST